MNVLIEHHKVFTSAFLSSGKLCLLAALGALVLGTFVAALRISPLPPLRALGTTYVNVFRNTPLTIVFFMTAFGLPELGIRMPYFRFAVLALTLYTAAFVCEAIRSGINSVPAGQAEAARSIGLRFSQVLGLVVLPQAFRATIPPLGSVIIAMIKNSAIASAFGVTELLARGDSLIAQGESAVWSLLGAGVGFLVLTIPLALGMSRLERRLETAR